MTNSDQTDYGSLYDRNAAEIDLLDVIRENPINIALLPGTNQGKQDSMGNVFGAIFGDAYARQQRDIKDEKARPTLLKARTGSPISELCEHNIRDGFHGPDSSEHKCLVCKDVEFSTGKL